MSDLCEADTFVWSNELASGALPAACPWTLDALLAGGRAALADQG